MVYLGTYNGYLLAMDAIDGTLEPLMKENTYRHMIKMAGEIARIMEKTASGMRIPFALQEPPLCMSYHFKKTCDATYQVDKHEIVKKSYFHLCCNKYGVLFAPPSRIYLDTSMDERNLRFF